MKKINQKKYSGGQAVFIVVVLFLFISTSVVFGVSAPVLKQVKNGNENYFSKQSLYLAESAMEDAVYRIKNNKNINSGDTVSIDGYTASVNVTTNMDNKIIDTVSNRDGIVRKTEVSLAKGVGTAFNYGIQTGTGGFVLNGGSIVYGNVYSNGDIVATNGVNITGSAFAANSVAIVADQTNNSPETPPNNISFRDTNSTQDFAQSFQVLNSSPLNKISFYIKKVGSPADIVVRIVNDSSGSPGTSNIFSTQGTLSASLVSSSSFGWVDVVFPENPELIPGVTYWVVLSNSSRSSSNYYVIGANSGYSNGVAKVGKYSGSWSNTVPAGLDGYFKIFLGGLTSSIGGSTYVGGVNIGTGGIGDAWANYVQGANVAGNLYCKTGSYNNKSCNTSRPDPSPQPYPVSESNIQDWKDEAESGGVISGNYSVGYAGATIGPKKITGNLTVAGGGTLTITGTVWVQGTISVSGGGKIKLASSYGSGSGVILSDGHVVLNGGGLLTGSGTAGSYLLILTTSNCPLSPSCSGNNAMSVSGGAGAVILSAQNGIMYLSGGVSAKAATAYKILAEGGTTITYESGISDINFSSGPSGGWNISSWQEVP